MNDWKRMNKIFEEIQQHTYKCKCGHSVVIPPKEKSKICWWCNKIVFKNEKEEFIYTLKEKMKRRDENGKRKYL